MPQSFPAELRIINYVATVLGADDSLEAINTSKLSDRAIVACKANNSLYMLRKESTDAPSGTTIVEPSAGPGRWHIYSPGGDAGSVPPLTRTFWVDAGRAGSTEDGSIAQPFLTVQGAVDAALDIQEEGSQTFVGTVLICPGADYSAQNVEVNPEGLSTYGQINIIGLGGSYQSSNFARPAIKLGTVLVIAAFEGSPPTAQLQDLACASLTAVGGLVLTNVLPDTYDLSGADVHTDINTLQALRLSSGSPPPGGFLLPTARKSVVFGVPAIVSGSSADVTVTLSFPAVRIGDTFSVAPAGALAAGLLIGGAWCETDGDVTVRFSGTYGGGNVTLNINLNPNSA